MADITDKGYDEATDTNDGRGAVVDVEVVTEDEDDTSTDDNPLDDAHSAEDIANDLTAKSLRPSHGDINSRDNEAEWSKEEV